LFCLRSPVFMAASAILGSGPERTRRLARRRCSSGHCSASSATNFPLGSRHARDAPHVRCKGLVHDRETGRSSSSGDRGTIVSGSLSLRGETRPWCSRPLCP
jgi:hypothetical protein